MKSSKYWIIGIAVFCLLLIILLYLRHIKYYPSTDDAYIKAPIISIAPQVTGSVALVKVHDLQFVKKGEVLFELDQRPFQIAFDSAQANYTDVEKSSTRTKILVGRRLLSPATGDQAESNLKIAKSNLDQAKLNLEYAIVRAPEDGYIAKMELRPGTTVSAYQPVFFLVGSHHWWAEANFKETQLKRIKPGQKATVMVDAYPDHQFQGVVDNVSRGSGAIFSLLPPENATGNWVKVTARFPVRITITNPQDEKYPLRVGASATVTINTKNSE